MNGALRDLKVALGDMDAATLKIKAASDELKAGTAALLRARLLVDAAQVRINLLHNKK